MGVGFRSPRQLERSDESLLTTFSCGNEMIDTWFQSRALKARERGTAVVYVSVADSGEIAGFYSLSSSSLDRNGTRGWLGRNSPEEIPVILLGMLGVDARFQGCGLGTDLVLDSLHRSLSVAQVIGAKAMVVDPYDAEATRFYEHLGFSHIPSDKKMFARLFG